MRFERVVARGTSPVSLPRITISHAVGYIRGHDEARLCPRLHGSGGHAPGRSGGHAGGACFITIPSILPAAACWRQVAVWARRHAFLARRSPAARFVSVDVSAESLALARAAASSEGLTNVEFQEADLFALPFPNASFDHVFVCFVLEHLRQARGCPACPPARVAAGRLADRHRGRSRLGLLPPQECPRPAHDRMLESGAGSGGRRRAHRAPAVSALAIGGSRRRAGIATLRVRRRQPPALGRRLHPQDLHRHGRGRGRAGPLRLGLIDQTAWDEGIADLKRSAEDDGTFCYTFFKAVARKA
jgi:hypothetical protein